MMENFDEKKLAEIWQISERSLKKLIKSRKLTVCEAAELLGVKKRTVYELISEGQLPAYRFRNQLRIPERGVTDFIVRRMLKTCLE